MNTKSATKLQPETALANPIFVEPERLVDRLMELHQQIAPRAYEFYDSRGREVGYELDDWLRAESELLCPVPVEIRESDQQLKVRAEVSDFGVDELEVSIEPRRVLISGQKKQEKEGEQVCTERRPNKVFRALDLPVEVDPVKVTGTLKDGVLNFRLPKVIAQALIQAE